MDSSYAIKKGVALAFAFSALSSTATVAAEATAPRAVPMSMAEMAGVTFDEADRDNSGFIDAAEAEALDIDIFDYDVNNDGIVDHDEWARAPERAMEPGPGRAPADMAGVTFEEADLDDSGFIDATEAKELGLDVVEYDVNFNGVIDRTEWERAPEEATEPGRDAGPERGLKQDTERRRY